MKAFLCRIGRHRWFISSIDFAGNQSKRLRYCQRVGCTAVEQQRLTWGGRPTGSWRDATRHPCTHATDGGPLLACMQCAVDWGNRGLV